METNELRRGNWVSCRSINDQVETIKKSTITTKTGYGILVDTDKIFPVPLTEQWLKDFGFEQDTDIEYLKECHNTEIAFYTFGEDFIYDKIFFINNEWVFATSELESNSNIQYVHSLQNLYFALTGKELTLKLKDNE